MPEITPHAEISRMQGECPNHCTVSLALSGGFYPEAPGCVTPAQSPQQWVGMLPGVEGAGGLSPYNLSCQSTRIPPLVVFVEHSRPPWGTVITANMSPSAGDFQSPFEASLQKASGNGAGSLGESKCSLTAVL